MHWVEQDGLTYSKSGGRWKSVDGGDRVRTVFDTMQELSGRQSTPAIGSPHPLSRKHELGAALLARLRLHSFMPAV